MKLAALAALCAGAAVARAAPDEAWRTVETEHYRLHYPVDTEAWALEMAGQLEQIRERVSAEVGYEPKQRVEIVVLDPWARANGFALPMGSRPRMGVFPTAPGASTTIGHYRSWSEDLVVHEDAHLVHLLRPSRNLWARGASRLLVGSGPIALKSPAWVIEGYATVVEGRLTGKGRPNSDARASFLRYLAHDGQLPTYGQLDGSDMWQAGAMRYLVGSAYLEWLEENSHEGALRDLWARMTAKTLRSFDDAFIGVFGDDPATLYARFAAELTRDALLTEAMRPPDAGTLWADLTFTVSAPTVSPDGSKVAVVQYPKRGTPRLTVWSTAADETAESTWREPVDKALEKDPLDVAPVPPEVFPREALEERVHGGRVPYTPRFLDDGQTLLFTSFLLDGKGEAFPDLFTWNTESGRERRITHHADVRDADPHGDWAIGVRLQNGRSNLVRVDLGTGEVSDVTEPAHDVVDDWPRVSPDGSQVAWIRHKDEAWSIVIRTLEGGAEETVPLGPDVGIYSLAWGKREGALLASLGHGGFVELYVVHANGETAQLTQTVGGALYGDPAEGGIFYLEPDFEGFDLRFQALPSPTREAHAFKLKSAVVLPDPPANPPPLASGDAPEPRKYGIGHPEFRPLIGSSQTVHQGYLDVGLRAGDILGRWEVVGLASLDQAVGRGGVAGVATYRGLPVRLRAWGWGMGQLRDLHQPGLAFDMVGDHQWRWGGARADLGAWSWTAPMLRAAVAADHALWLGPAWLGAGGAASLNQPVGDGAFAVQRGELGLAGGAFGLHTGARLELARAPDGAIQLGGLEPSFLPEGPLAATIFDPAVPAVHAGEAYHGLHVEIAYEGQVALTADREEFGTPGPAVTRVGVEMMGSAAAVPLGKVPGVRLDGGVACVLETPDEGWRSKPCRNIDHYAAWIGLRWLPGEASWPGRRGEPRRGRPGVAERE